MHIDMYMCIRIVVYIYTHIWMFTLQMCIKHTSTTPEEFQRWWWIPVKWQGKSALQTPKDVNWRPSPRVQLKGQKYWASGNDSNSSIKKKNTSQWRGGFGVWKWTRWTFDLSDTLMKNPLFCFAFATTYETPFLRGMCEKWPKRKKYQHLGKWRFMSLPKTDCLTVSTFLAIDPNFQQWCNDENSEQQQMCKFGSPLKVWKFRQNMNWAFCVWGRQ